MNDGGGRIKAPLTLGLLKNTGLIKVTIKVIFSKLCNFKKKPDPCILKGFVDKTYILDLCSSCF